MNALADLVAAGERVDEMETRLQRQEAIILRFHALGALPALIEMAERLRRNIADRLDLAIARRDE